MSNSVGPDETTNHEPSHLDLLCLQKFIIIASGSERVKYMKETLRQTTKIASLHNAINRGCIHVLKRNG